MTSGDLNIDLTQKKLFTKVVSRSTNYQTPLPFVATIRAFRVLTGAKKAPARFRVFQSPPGIRLSAWTIYDNTPSVTLTVIQYPPIPRRSSPSCCGPAAAGARVFFLPVIMPLGDLWYAYVSYRCSGKNKETYQCAGHMKAEQKWMHYVVYVIV